MFVPSQQFIVCLVFVAMISSILRDKSDVILRVALLGWPLYITRCPVFKVFT